MLNEELKAKGILKEEKAQYLKSKVNLLQGHIYLTPSHLIVEAHKANMLATSFGLIGALLFRKAKPTGKNEGFELELKNIATIQESKHGLTKGLLEVIDNTGKSHRMFVKDWRSWEEAINKQK